MPGGERDSSKTRVAPVFDRLRERRDPWVHRLLGLVDSDAARPLASLDLAFQSGYWGESERGLDPPVSLLSWLIRNPPTSLHSPQRIPDRERLALGDPATVEQALKLLRASGERSGWYIFEGPTYPDVIIETPAALLVVEGKRTESGPTTYTTHMPGRHQIWRHIDAAWEIRGHRRVFGLFIVEGTPPAGDVPVIWQRAVEEARSPEALDGSFPHRSADERSAIARSLVGVTTWQRVCAAFEIQFSDLPDRLGGERPP